ncbi:unnamed protein product [Heligmosomoides polygyrus]|uniref:Uncharacterized protein n=1 Tax=Heligmosomoides polygyrus TaxID=6339 RepID=A0A3P8BRV1_HELPZ|nr:unnamed protein product [Heligmosomoides polygyrus]
MGNGNMSELSTPPPVQLSEPLVPVPAPNSTASAPEASGRKPTLQEVVHCLADIELQAFDAIMDNCFPDKPDVFMCMLSQGLDPVIAFSPTLSRASSGPLSRDLKVQANLFDGVVVSAKDMAVPPKTSFAQLLGYQGDTEPLSSLRTRSKRPGLSHPQTNLWSDRRRKDEILIARSTSISKCGRRRLPKEPEVRQFFIGSQAVRAAVHEQRFITKAEEEPFLLEEEYDQRSTGFGQRTITSEILPNFTDPSYGPPVCTVVHNSGP